jgi:hypothetical protein
MSPVHADAHAEWPESDALVIQFVGRERKLGTTLNICCPTI